MTQGNILGTLCSPYILDKFGYFGSYGISAMVIAVALVYVVVVVREPLVKKTEEGPMLYNFFVLNLRMFVMS